MQRQFTISLLTDDGKQINMEVKSKYSKLQKRKVKTWTTEEDNQLIALYEQLPRKWTEIAMQMTDRNENQCLHRYRRLCQLGAGHKIWSSEEDEMITKLVAKYGRNWKLLSQLLGTKNGKQIRERFINKLDPKIIKGDWQEAEDRKILELYTQFGSKWSEISKQLPGRPENKIKNRFYSFIQKNYSIRYREIVPPDYLQSEAVIGSEVKLEEVAEQHNNCHQLQNINPQSVVNMRSLSMPRGLIDVLNSYSQADEIREYDKCPDDKYCRKHRGDSEEKILSRLVIPSIGDIDDGLRPERMCSSMLESTAGLRLAEDWRRNLDDRSVQNINQNESFDKFEH